MGLLFRSVQAATFAKFFAKSTACLAILLFALTACDKPLPPPELPPIEKSDHILTRAIYSAHIQLDPHFVKVVADAAPVRDLFVGLMAFDAQGNVVPALAKSQFSDDGKRWLFILDEAATWSNGEPVTADDFVASWQRLLDPKNPSPWAGYLAEIGIENAQAILNREEPIFELGVQALNANTLQIDLENPNFQLPKALSHFALLPTYQGKPPSKPLISNGAYQLDLLEPQRAFLLARNDQPAFKQVIYQLITTAQNPARFDLLENPFPAYTQNVRSLPRLCTYFYEFNFNDPWVGQKAVREAIRAMISSSEISKQLGIANYSALPRTQWSGNRRLETKSAEQILARAGVEMQNGLKIHLAFSTNDQDQQIASRFTRLLSQSDLFRVRWQEMEFPLLASLREQQLFQLIQREQCANYDDPIVFLRPFHSHSPENKNGYGNESVDLWLDELSGEQGAALSDDERQMRIGKIVQQLNDDIAILPLFQEQRRIAADPSLDGIDVNNASEVIYSKDLSRKPKKDTE